MESARDSRLGHYTQEFMKYFGIGALIGLGIIGVGAVVEQTTGALSEIVSDALGDSFTEGIIITDTQHTLSGSARE